MELSYAQSQAVILLALTALLIRLVRRLIPIRFSLFRALNHKMVERKGVFWTCLIWWSLAIIAVCFVTLVIQSDVLIQAKVMICAVLPIALVWWLRSLIRKRRQRRYVLPGRRR